MGLPIALLVALAVPSFTDDYELSVAVSILTFAMLGLGLNIVVGYAGLLDLGYAAFFAIGAYTSALLEVHAGLTFWETLPFSIAATGIAGVIIGYPTLRLRSDYLAIVTLGFGEIVRITATNLKVTGGPNGLYGIDAISVFGQSMITDRDGLYFIALGMVAVVLLYCWALSRSRLGRAWRSLREDETAAEAVGIPTTRVKLLAYVMGAFVGGLAGPFFAARFGAIDPTSFTYLASIQILIVVVLGGMGSLPGMILGAVVVIGLPEALRPVADYRNLGFAFALIALMILRPGGLWPARRRAHPAAGPPAADPAPAVTGDLAEPAIPVTQRSADQALLVVRDLRRTFGGVVAVNNINFEVHAGEVLSIIGPNGAGKTSVFNAITGMNPPDSGTVEVTGFGNVVGRSPHRVVETGIARTFQGIRLFNGMTAAENVMVGLFARHTSVLLARLSRKQASSRAKERGIALHWLDFVGLAHRADDLASALSYGDRRRLEIARALASEPCVLLLDEPAAGTNHTEKQALIDLIRQISSTGIAVVLIEHDMTVVMDLSDRVLVMENGGLLAEGLPAQVQADPRVIEAYLGTDDDLLADLEEVPS